MKRFELVDFLKGFSICTIVMMHLLQAHTGGMVNNALSFGGAGVHVFILCSGFGLYLSYLRKPLRYPQFLRRRFMKVYVPYIIIILLSAAVPFYYVATDKWQAILSHVLLYKMFCPQWESSFGQQMWFVSTIIQFYLCWPLIVKLFRYREGYIYALIISLLYSTIVALLGKSDERVWNSFFLQYLWEFVWGMKLAVVYSSNPDRLRLPSMIILLPLCLVCMAMTGYAGMKGGVWKVYNDIPSLFSYLSMALIVYKTKLSNNLFIFTNRFSYEWYLVHILIFGVISYYFADLPVAPLCVLSFILSYIAGWGYERILRTLRLK